MMYFLDFDRTLFDSDAYNRSLIDEPGCAPFKEEIRAVLEQGREHSLSGGKQRQIVWDKLSEAIASGAVVFPPGHLTRFLYADVAEFLRGLGNEAVIVTFGQIDRQRVKVESSLAGIPRVTAWYTGDMPKADFMKEKLGSYSAPLYFVDDHPLEIARMQELCPQVTLFEMRRDGKEGDGRWPVVRSLTELP